MRTIKRRNHSKQQKLCTNQKVSSNQPSPKNEKLQRQGNQTILLYILLSIDFFKWDRTNMEANVNLIMSLIITSNFSRATLHLYNRMLIMYY